MKGTWLQIITKTNDDELPHVFLCCETPHLLLTPEHPVVVKGLHSEWLDKWNTGGFLQGLHESNSLCLSGGYKVSSNAFKQ